MIPDTLRSLRSLTRSRMTTSLIFLANRQRRRLAEGLYRCRHSRPRERPKGAESVGNPCLNTDDRSTRQGSGGQDKQTVGKNAGSCVLPHGRHRIASGWVICGRSRPNTARWTCSGDRRLSRAMRLGVWNGVPKRRYATQAGVLKLSQVAPMPASTGSAAPVMPVATGEVMKAIAAAMSRGDSTRPSGWRSA
jgi:hypothetical protein